jgi:hypothetical protein
VARHQVTHTRVAFEAEVDKIVALLQRTSTAGYLAQNGKHIRFGNRYVERVAEYSLLRMHLAWETFLEDSFLRYLCGAATVSGYRPTLLQPQAPTIEHAFRSLLRQPHYTYLDWSRQRTSAASTARFHNGGSYVTPLANASRYLDEIAVIRNRIAHRSDSTSTEFNRVVRSYYARLVPGMTVGRFLVNPGLQPLLTSQSFFQSYVSLLRATAGQIVP